MFFTVQSFEQELTPNEVILGDSSRKKFVKSFEIRSVPVEVFFGKLKRVIPYGNRFSTEDAEIIEMTEVFYMFGKKIYSYANRKLEEVKIKIVEKKELILSKKCKYKMYLATFYDEVSQETFTKYLVDA